MGFILGCMGTAVKAALGGFFICVVIVLLGLIVYGFNYTKNSIKDAIESKHDVDYSDTNDLF